MVGSHNPAGAVLELGPRLDDGAGADGWAAGGETVGGGAAGGETAGGETARDETARDETVPALLGAFMESARELATMVVPVWVSHLGSCQQQTGEAVEALVSRFDGIVRSLDTLVAAAGTALDGHSEEAFGAARTRLDGVVDMLGTVVTEKQRTIEGLRELGTVNRRVRLMTAEVAGIAAQARLLSLNAAIEAARFGESGKAFGVVAAEFRDLANRSATAASGMGEMTEEISSSIDRALALAEEEAAREEDLVNQANEAVNAVLGDLEGLVGAAQDSSAELRTTAGQISQEVSEALVHFQFQDRVSQVVGHVTEALEGFASTLLEATVNGPESLVPLDCVSLMAQLQATYTMDEERLRHGAGAAPGGTGAPGGAGDITFF